MDDIHLWADRLESTIAGLPRGVLDRVRVMATTASTQDAACEAAGQRPGMVLVAGRQTGGRGRLGRSWHDDRGQGISLSLAIAPSQIDPLFSLRMGLATMNACDAALSQSCRLRWPNDVLEPRAGGRKIAGVLIEVRDGLAVIGIGINVYQKSSDWPAELHNRAVSLCELGSDHSRIDVSCLLLPAIVKWMDQTNAKVIDEWRERESLIGQHRTFRVGQRTVNGAVMDIEPDGRIAVRLENGEIERLDTAHISLVHDETEP